MLNATLLPDHATAEGGGPFPEASLRARAAVAREIGLLAQVAGVPGVLRDLQRFHGNHLRA